MTSLNWIAFRYVFPLESVTVNTWPDLPARITTPIQLPAVLAEGKVIVVELAVPASLLLC
jgi:hypothetical protein